MEKIEIIGIAQSNFVRTVRMAAHEKGVPYDLTEAMAHTDPVKELHPGGLIPAMRHGGKTLFESRAITRYIDEAFDGEPLTPREPFAAAQTEQWISFVGTSIDNSIVRRLIGAYFFSKNPDKSPDRAAIDAVKDRIAHHIQTLDKQVAKTGFLGGDRFTLADMYLMPILGISRLVPESKAALDASPNLLAYYEKHKTRPSFADTAPQKKK